MDKKKVGKLRRESDEQLEINSDAENNNDDNLLGKREEPTEIKTGSKDEIAYELTKKKRVSVSKWKGNILINFREFYEKDGQMLPTKKGICLTEDSWCILKSLIPHIDKAMKRL